MLMRKSENLRLTRCRSVAGFMASVDGRSCSRHFCPIALSSRFTAKPETFPCLRWSSRRTAPKSIRQNRATLTPTESNALAAALAEVLSSMRRKVTEWSVKAFLSLTWWSCCRRSCAAVSSSIRPDLPATMISRCNWHQRRAKRRFPRRLRNSLG